MTQVNIEAIREAIHIFKSTEVGSDERNLARKEWDNLSAHAINNATTAREMREIHNTLRNGNLTKIKVALYEKWFNITGDHTDIDDIRAIASGKGELAEELRKKISESSNI